MKYILQRTVTILLALAVLGCAVWYLFVYDRDFTRDMLVSQARYLDDAGHHELAALFYDYAYHHADNDASVALELAEQYKEVGNFTKAEFTLTKAISKNPTVELYVALCQTFVEQDKLIDAVRLLDQISDPALKQELNALRPSVPAVSLAPGFYSEYINVELADQTGTILFSTDREYPSLEDDRYAAPIVLPLGETTVYALCIGENGLLSPLGVYGYTIGGVIEKVTFEDPFIEAEIRKILEVDEGTAVYTDDLWTITALAVPENATAYSDLSKLTALKTLSLYNADPNSLGFLKDLPQIEDLTIFNSELNQSTLNAISAMTGLTRLTLAQCSLSNLSFLSSLSQLSYLDLSYNFVKDLTALTELNKLEALYLPYNAVVDLTPLSVLTNLRILNVSHNSITSILPVCSNRNLEELNVSNNLLTGLADLDLLPKLAKLTASHNSLSSITVLGRCYALTELDISNNGIVDISSLATATSLRKLNCSHNRISDLPEWSSSCGLIILDSSYNNISDVTGLGLLYGLNKVNLDYNPELSSVEALARCSNLIEVNLFGTKVTDVSMLTSQSVIVNYNPTEVDVNVPEPTE